MDNFASVSFLAPHPTTFTQTAELKVNTSESLFVCLFVFTFDEHADLLVLFDRRHLTDVWSMTHLKWQSRIMFALETTNTALKAARTQMLCGLVVGSSGLYMPTRRGLSLSLSLCLRVSL